MCSSPDRLMRSLLGCLVFSVALSPLSAAEHPRLFCDAADVPKFRAKADQSPWKDMLESISWAVDHDRNNGYERGLPRAANAAALYLFRGDAADADSSLNDCLYLILSPDRDGKPVWGDPGYKSLTRAGRANQVLQSYDLCYDAWKGKTLPEKFTTRDGLTHEVPKELVGGDVNAFISKSLKENADSLVKNGGKGWPGSGKWGNNWNAVRYGTAVLSYLACDEPRESWQKDFDGAMRNLVKHKQANLSTSPQANGWNPEGIAYAQYPGWTTYPLVVALRRLEGRDLIEEVPAMENELWTTYQGVLPLPRHARVSGPGETREGWGLGLRPDFTDDHPVWEAEGTAALAFAVSPKEYLPGLKWLYRRLCGDLGDRTWDTASGNGLYSLLFYPADLEEKNPAEVWGKTWKDEAFGVFIFRNRFQDGDDFVLQTVAKLRPTFGGHEGRDALSFRLWGLGVPWAVGSGRTTDQRGQTSVFPSDPEEKATPPPGLVPAVVDAFLRRNGDGYVVMKMAMSDTGVSDHTRRIVADYSGESGAPALVLVSDSSEDGQFWRMNTPDFNTITTGPNSFTITGPQGQRLDATILWPASGVTPRTGTFERGSPFAFADINYDPAAAGNGMAGYGTQNKWVDFESPDGKFLVAITVVPADAQAPKVTSKGEGVSQTVEVGKRVIVLGGNQISVDGWTRPEVSISRPGVGDTFHAGETDVQVSGTAADVDGIERVEVSLDGRRAEPAEVQDDGSWQLVFAKVAPGPHEVSARATDAVGDEGAAVAAFEIHKTQPPTVVLEAPGKDAVVKPGSDVIFEGTVADPEGREVKVSLRAGEKEIGKAEVEDGKFRYVWEAVPVGEYEVTAQAVDADGDQTDSEPLRVLVPYAIGKGNVSEATRLWVGDYGDFSSPPEVKAQNGFNPQVDGAQRWSIREVDGAPALHVRESQKWDFGDRFLWVRGSKGVKNWRLEWKMKMESSLEKRPAAMVHFGTGIAGPLTMDFRPVESVRFEGKRKGPPPKGSSDTTRLWYHATNGNRPEIGWTVTAHTKDDEGFPDKPGTTSAGIPDDQWHSYKMERVGRTLKVWRDDKLILEAENPWIASVGPVGFANERVGGDLFDVKDISFTEL